MLQLRRVLLTSTPVSVVDIELKVLKVYEKKEEKKVCGNNTRNETCQRRFAGTERTSEYDETFPNSLN